MKASCVNASCCSHPRHPEWLDMARGNIPPPDHSVGAYDYPEEHREDVDCWDTVYGTELRRPDPEHQTHLGGSGWLLIQYNCANATTTLF